MSDFDQPLRDESIYDDELISHWLPSYVPTRSVDENAFSLARPLWGKACAEWAWCLAKDVVARFPEANEHSEGAGWVAGVLWVAAKEFDMEQTEELWEHVVADITTMTSVSRQTAERRWQMIKQAGLERPEHPPACWN